MRRTVSTWWRSPARNDDIFYGLLFGSIVAAGVYGLVKW